MSQLLDRVCPISPGDVENKSDAWTRMLILEIIHLAVEKVGNENCEEIAPVERY